MPKTTWIDTAEQLQDFCDQVGDSPLAVDTESDHFHSYQARVCLIQLATTDAEAIVDPLELDADDLAPLFELFEDPEVTKVLHSARNDLRELDRDYQIDVNNVFDTQVAARFLDYERNSLSWMLEELLDVDTGGQYQRYDWTTRPLPDEVFRYAADDVRHLLELQSRFSEELEADGWFGPFCQQCQFVSESSEYVPKDFDPEKWRKINGSKRLDGRGRAALSALYRWRHKLCDRLNQSAVTTFPNAAIIKLAKKRPTTAEGVASIRRVPEKLADEYGDQIADIISQSLSADIPPKKLPRKKRRKKSPSPQERALYNSLRSWRNETSERLGVPSPFLATNATLTEIAAQPPQSLADLARFDAILDWHVDLLGDEMLGLIGQPA